MQSFTANETLGEGDFLQTWQRLCDRLCCEHPGDIGSRGAGAEGACPMPAWLTVLLSGAEVFQASKPIQSGFAAMMDNAVSRALHQSIF